jgi:hypothetical protein
MGNERDISWPDGGMVASNAGRVHDPNRIGDYEAGIAKGRAEIYADVDKVLLAAVEWARYIIDSVDSDEGRFIYVKNHELHYVAEIDLFDAIKQSTRCAELAKQQDGEG